MGRLISLFSGIACAAAVLSTPASAYEIDPLTRQPLISSEDIYRPQASAIPRETVSFNEGYGAGTIVISTKQRRLYYVLGMVKPSVTALASVARGSLGAEPLPSVQSVSGRIGVLRHR